MIDTKAVKAMIAEARDRQKMCEDDGALTLSQVRACAYTFRQFAAMLEEMLRALSSSEEDGIEGLLPCPFCGGEAERIDIEQEGENFGGSCIGCKKCGASSPVHFDRKENLESSWNQRATLLSRANAREKDWNAMARELQRLGATKTVEKLVSELKAGTIVAPF